METTVGSNGCGRVDVGCDGGGDGTWRETRVAGIEAQDLAVVAASRTPNGWPA
jgi:hypothetical protein